MDGTHDLGGKPGFGPVVRGGDAERTFVADWQRRVFGLVGLGLSTLANTDAFRHAIERLPAETYRAGYWTRWLAALQLLVDEDDASVRRTASTARRDLDRRPRFAVGNAVRTQADGVPGHTRLPGYARGRRGQIVRHQGAWVFPDTNAHGDGEQPQHLYTVAFSARELFGEDADAHARVSLDLFEPYLSKEDG